MRFKEFLGEALKPSQYRSLMKKFNPERYDAFFRKHASDKRKTRIYIPLDSKESDSAKPDPKVKDALSKMGYEVEDYKAGLATKDGKRLVRIGKLLVDQPEIKKVFDNDKTRAASKKNEKLIVISRHPYDIGGMSTDRGWNSCMRLTDKAKGDISGGEYEEYVPTEIEHGALVAYLIDANDPDIKNPMARVLIRPYINTDDVNDVLLVASSNVYGSAPAAFLKTVDKWLEEFNGRNLSGLYCMDVDKHYKDADDPEVVVKGDPNDPFIILVKSTENNEETPLAILKNIKSLNEKQADFLFSRINSGPVMTRKAKAVVLLDNLSKTNLDSNSVFTISKLAARYAVNGELLNRLSTNQLIELITQNGPDTIAVLHDIGRHKAQKLIKSNDVVYELMDDLDMLASSSIVPSKMRQLLKPQRTEMIKSVFTPAAIEEILSGKQAVTYIRRFKHAFKMLGDLGLMQGRDGFIEDAVLGSADSEDALNSMNEFGRFDLLTKLKAPLGEMITALKMIEFKVDDKHWKTISHAIDVLIDAELRNVDNDDKLRSFLMDLETLKGLHKYEGKIDNWKKRLDSVVNKYSMITMGGQDVNSSEYVDRILNSIKRWTAVKD